MLKVVETAGFARLGEDQFAVFFPQVNCGAGQAVGDGRALRGGAREAGLAVFVIGPQQFVAVFLQAMVQAVAPAETQAALAFDGAGAVQARPFEGQHAIEHGVGEGQQFFAGDHRHRAALGAGFVSRFGGLVVEVFRLRRDVVDVLNLHDFGVGLGFAAHHQGGVEQ